MKLRINSTSIRLRLLRSEVTKFAEAGRIEETIRFASGEDAFLTYALESESGLNSVAIRYRPCEVAVVLPKQFVAGAHHLLHRLEGIVYGCCIQQAALFQRGCVDHRGLEDQTECVLSEPPPRFRLRICN